MELRDARPEKRLKSRLGKYMFGALFSLLGLSVAGVAMAGGGGDDDDNSSAARASTPPPAEPITDETPVLTPEPKVAPASESEPEPTPEPKPAPAPTPEPTPVVAPALPPTPSQASSNGPQTGEATVFDGSETIAIDGGRVTTLELDTEGSIKAIEIVNGPNFGNATVNPDNSIALVLSGSDYAGPLGLSYKVTMEDGTTQVETLQMSVSAPSQEAGWGMGQHYMLEEDENGDIIVETGDDHRKVYVTESEHGLTREDIALLENLDVSDITSGWLIGNPEYGGSEDMALATDVGMDVWRDLTIWTAVDPTSNWLLFEKGYEYDADATGRIIDRGATGESELHPLHITSWGEGDKPIISASIQLVQNVSENIVFSDLALTGEFKSLDANNIILSDVGVSEKGVYVQFADNFTLHDSEVAHVGAGATPPEGDSWGNTRVQGFFAHEVDGLLIEGSIIHHNGWEDDYLTSSSTEGGLPPSTFSQNIYLQNTTSDVTITNNIISQGASFGIQARGGAYIEDNAFIDNNMAASFLGGIYKTDGPIGNYTLFTDNLITSAGYKQLDNYSIGAFSAGFENAAYDSTLLDNIVTHVADPSNPDEIAEKLYAHYAVQNEYDPVYDDTVIYNWEAEIGVDLEQNVEGIDRDLANQTTIQNFANQVMGREATIGEFMDYLIELADTEYDDTITADDIIAYFQNSFGVDLNGDEAQTEHRFIPNDLADGIRWDNRLNWDTEDVPDDGDNVSLAGNWVQYGATTTVGDLDLGSGGKLDVNYGRFTVDGTLSAGEDGAEITTNSAGQFWIDGYSDDARLTINVDDGRFANTGDFTGTTSIEVTEGQALLGVDDASMVLSEGSELRLTDANIKYGDTTKAGFDGEENGISTLKMEDGAVMSYVADENSFVTLEEFRSGKFDQDAPQVQSGVMLDGTLQLDLSLYAAGEGSHTLIDVDALDGTFDDVHVYGLDGGLDANIFIDYETDQLRLDLTAGSGTVTFDTVGTAGNGTDEAADLWSALTSGQGTYTDASPEIYEEEDELPDLLSA